MSNYCPCGNNKTFLECCEPFINAKKLPETAEELMRSRYTAFTKGKVDYILKTHEAGTRPAKERNKMLKWMNAVEWLGLAILSTEKGLKNDNSGMVEFRAIFIENGFTQALHEKSVFVKHKGAWMYANGEQF